MRGRQGGQTHGGAGCLAAAALAIDSGGFPAAWPPGAVTLIFSTGSSTVTA